ncbi:MAG: hypothetical protein AAGF84_06315 [Planctomycetota bacterium]
MLRERLEYTNRETRRDRLLGACLPLAGYCFPLALLPILGVADDVLPEPVAHRIVLCVVFAWVVLVSVHLLRTEPNPSSDPASTPPSSREPLRHDA